MQGWYDNSLPLESLDELEADRVFVLGEVAVNAGVTVEEGVVEKPSFLLQCTEDEALLVPIESERVSRQR